MAEDPVLNGQLWTRLGSRQFTLEGESCEGNGRLATMPTEFIETGFHCVSQFKLKVVPKAN